MTGHGSLKPGWGKPELVGALQDCLSRWEAKLAAGSSLVSDLPALMKQNTELEPACRNVGFGGVAHHLAELSRLAQQGASSASLMAQLGVVRELLSSARASLSEDERQRISAPAPASPDALTPPPLLSGYFKSPLDAASPAPPAPLQASAAPPAGGMPAPPRMLTMMGDNASPAGSSPPPGLSSPLNAGAARPLPPGLGVNAPAPPLASPSSPRPPAPLPASSSGPPPPATRPQQPNLMVRTVLGLRAFSRKDSSPPSPPSPVGPAPAPPAAPAAQPSLLGLKRSSAPPAPVGGGYGGLSPLGALPPAPPGFGGQSLPGAPLPGALPSDAELPRPGRGRNRTPSPTSSTQPKLRRPAAGGRKRRRDEGGESRWWIGALAALGVCAVVLGIVLVAVTVSRRGSGDASDAGVTGASSAAAADSPAPASSGAMPRGRLLNDDERLQSLLVQVHGRGKESAELRNLLEEQASIAAQALKPGCEGAHCKALAEIGQLVTNREKRQLRRRSRSPDSMRSRWLAGLTMPEIPVEDDPRVQRRFEFYTENPVGRETFQQMLFRCGAYKDAIQSSLVRRGMPKDLIAVVYAESGCYPLAKSPAGAEGLWQFIPDAARAYHLRIIEGTVDERHSPQKATEAAIQYLSDLYAKFGEWDLVFSAYNVGPFGLAARLARVEGEKVGFWDLVDAGMLPGETADYAPAIQAIALILNNLQRLKFGGIQQRAPQMTMDLPVPPATRLTLVARAAALSLNELRALNLDLKGDATPNVPNFAVQVPKDSVWQARDTLQELIKSGDQSDLCAPQNFDWGRQRFTPEMQQACARRLAARAVEAP